MTLNLNITQKILVAATIFLSWHCYALQPGEITFDDLSKTYGEAKVEINLNRQLIGLVSSFSRNGDPEVAEILNGLQQITVRVYKMNNSVEAAYQAVEQVAKKIRKEDWLPLVSVNNNEQKVRIFSRSTNEKMDGLVVMVVDAKKGGEAVFINIVGEIDPAKISAVTQSLNININGADSETLDAAKKNN